MSLSALSIRRPVFAWMLMITLIVFGAVAFLKMGISQLPDVDFPVVSINLRLEGAAPEVIETEIIDFVEDAVMSVEGVQNVTSRSENSEGTVTVEFDIGRNIDLAVQDIQAKVSQVRSKLPKEITTVTISKTNPEDQPIVLLSLESDRYSRRDLMVYVSDRLKDQFAMVPGVGDLTLGGYVDPNLRIWVDGKKLERYQLSVSDLVDTVRAEHSEPPSGKIEDAADEHMFYVRTLGEADSVDAFGDIVVNQRGGQPNFQPIRLGQVARVEDGLADILRYSRSNGVAGVGLGVLKQRGTNAVAVAKAVRAKIEEVRKGLPEGMRLNVNFDGTKYIEQAVSELNFTLLLSALLTAIVCWGFLGSWASTFNVLLSIPTSVFGTFIVLYFLGFTLNTFTLLGLSLSIGIVVDDAIMVLENIVRHQEAGEDRVRAALTGAEEITFAALAATLSIIAIFLPVVFMKGVIGKFFFQFGITLTVAVALSLLEALTLTPMRCSKFVGIHERTTRIGKGIEWLLASAVTVYRSSLSTALRFRLPVVVLAFAFFGISLYSLTLLNREFLPSEDQSRFNIRLKTPIGTSLNATDARFREIEKFLASRPEVNRYVLQTGGGSPGDANSGSVLVTLKDPGHRGIARELGHEASQREFMDIARHELTKVKDVRVVIQDLAARAFSASRGFPVEFSLQGPEWDRLSSLSQTMLAELKKTALLTDIDLNYDAAMPEYRIIPDRRKAAARGVSIYAIGQTVNALIGGVLVGRYPKGGHRYDITLKLEDRREEPGKKLEGLTVRNNRGELVPLSDVVRIERSTSMVEINRLNRERSVTFFANVANGKSQQDALHSVEEVARRICPPGYHAVLSGSSQTFTDSFSSLITALILGLFVSYAILASQFDDFIDPLIVLMALPFSLSGALLGLLVTHQSINLYSMIGMVLLMGIVKKNSILIVDFTNQIRRHDRVSADEALLAACPIRLRPILMTSIATVAGALPSALALGPGAESRIPMAVAIIGGVIVSTFLSLYLVPCVYSLATARRDRVGAALTESL